MVLDAIINESLRICVVIHVKRRCRMAQCNSDGPFIVQEDKSHNLAAGYSPYTTRYVVINMSGQGILVYSV